MSYESYVSYEERSDVCKMRRRIHVCHMSHMCHMRSVLTSVR